MLLRITVLLIIIQAFTYASGDLEIESLPMTGGGAIELGKMYGVDDLLHDEVGVADNWMPALLVCAITKVDIL